MKIMTFKYLERDGDYARIYYRGSDGKLYALQDERRDDINEPDNAFYVCTEYGEPLIPVPVPDISNFDNFVQP